MNAFWGPASQQESIPSGSEIDPKTSIEQVSKDSKRAKSNNKISNIISSVLTVASALASSKESNQSKPIELIK